MSQPKPLGELLYCTLQNLYYYSILQQQELLQKGMTPYLHENCTISLNGPRGAGWSYALSEFLLKDCENAIIIVPKLRLGDMLVEAVGKSAFKRRGHRIVSAFYPDGIRGISAKTIIYSDYNYIKRILKHNMRDFNAIIEPALNAYDEKVLIKLH